MILPGIEDRRLPVILGSLPTARECHHDQKEDNKDSENKGIAEIIIAKQRNGPIGTVNLVWLPDYTKFANAER